MPDKKLTDSEIVKALECCVESDCDNCPWDEQTACNEYMKQDVLDLINRLQAENSNLLCNLTSLQNDLTDLQAENESLYKTINTMASGVGKINEKLPLLKAEAYKECVEMLRNLDFEIQDGKVTFDWQDFNTALKELVGDSE